MSKMPLSTPSEVGLHVRTIPESQQATGAFDRGKIYERKPIGMPHDLAPQKSIGPLFYWAWAQSDESGTIAMHPHQGFEILSYVLEGELFHSDSLGSRSQVTAGGAQVQQAGSGMSHEEVTGADRSAFFQIWLQPDLQSALQRPPRYGEHVHESFPRTEQSGVSIKTVLGEGSPISLVTDAQMHDVALAPGTTYARPLQAGKALIAVAVEGAGVWRPTEDTGEESIRRGDCATWRAHRGSELELKAADGGLRVVLIEVPTEVDYPLYR